MNMSDRSLLHSADVIIIGAGPTGISCAIECIKKGLSCIVLEKGVLVNSIFNFPVNMTFFSTSLKLEIGDIPFISNNDKPSRAEALEYYRRLVYHYNIDIHYKVKAQTLVTKSKYYEVICNQGIYEAKHVIVCTGYYDLPRLLNIKGEELKKVKHYYDEAHRYIDQDIVVIGGANSACDVALETWTKGAKVTMVVRDRTLYQNVKYWILPNIENRIKEGSIKAYFESEVIEIKPHSVRIKTPEKVIEIPNDYVLAMTGYTPDYYFLKEIGIHIGADESMTPYFDPETLESNLPNVYLAGVINAGLATNKLFIENTRDHAQIIINHILSKK
jgi:thioredoxin reductase (NADPH)